MPPVFGVGPEGPTCRLWESADALEASAERAHRMRTQATEPADATIESVESYEVVLTAESAARRV